VLRQYRVPLAVLASPSLVVTLVGNTNPPPAAPRNLTFRVRGGGSPGLPDGDLLLAVPQDATAGQVAVGTSTPFARPTDPSTLVKVTAQGDGVTTPAVLSNFSILFRSP